MTFNLEHAEEAILRDHCSDKPNRQHRLHYEGMLATQIE